MKQKNTTFLCACILLIVLNRSGQHLLFFHCKTSGFESLQFQTINWVAKFFMLNFQALTNQTQKIHNDFPPRDSHLAKIKIVFFFSIVIIRY